MNKLSVGQMIAIGAALLVLLCFFFPWIELNLLLASTSLSGFQLAAGNGPAGFAGQSSAAQLKSVAAILLLAAGGLSALVILYQYFNLNQQFNQNIMGMIAQKMFSYSFGAHGSLLGSVVVAGGGLLDLVRGNKKPTP